MDSQPSRDDRILEALEACRGRDDLSDPALADLAAEMAADPDLEAIHHRLRQIDVKLAAALHDVPVPQRLAGRLLERLGAIGATEPQPEVPAPAVEATGQSGRESQVAVPIFSQRISRRWLLAAALPLCAAACLFAAVWLGMQKAAFYSESRVLQEAIALFREGITEATETAAPPADYPFSRDLLRVAGMQWRPIRGSFLGRSGVAYELPAEGGFRAALYVVKCAMDGLPVAPPRRPAFTTANCFASAWQDGDLLYVLVVSGGEAAYRSCLTTAHGPVT